MFHIKRFEYMGSKKAGFCEYRRQIDMSVFQRKEDNPYGESAKYELIGLTVHKGATDRQGHYIAYTLRNESWFRFDDEEFT